MVCEFLTYREYQILYEEYRDIDPDAGAQQKRAALTGGAVGGALGGALGGAAGGPGGAAVGGAFGAASGAAIFTAVLGLYRMFTDKCNSNCSPMINSRTNYILCHAKCNLRGCNEAIARLKASKNILEKEKDPEKKAKLVKKYNETLQFFMSKKKHYIDQISDLEEARKSNKGNKDINVNVNLPANRYKAKK